MSSRICKEIGYFLPKKHCKQFLVKNYQDIFDKFTNIKDWISLLEKEQTREQHNLSSQDKINLQCHIRDLKDKFNLSHNKWSCYDLISNIYFGDTEKGILIKTPELIIQSRNDNLIDYFENRSSLKNKCQLLHAPLVSYGNYQYLGGLNFSKEEEAILYQQGLRQDNSDLWYSALRQLTEKYHFTEGEAYSFILNKNRHFHPYIECFPLFLLKISSLLKPNCDINELKKYLEPAILTYWN